MASRNAEPFEERENSRALLPPHITCQRCSKLINELGCLHCFCGQCLHKEIERSQVKQNMECPTCQRNKAIPEGEVNAIPQKLHLGFEVEVAGYMSKIGSDGEKSRDACIDGSTVPAVVFCCTCHHLLCKTCHDYHKSKMLSQHQMVELNKESLRSIIKSTECSYSQPHHTKEELKFYCETCQLLSYPVKLHKDHSIADMFNIAKVYKDAMREALECVQEVDSKLTRAIDANGKMTEQVETSRGKATPIITQAFEQLHQTIEERKKTLLSEMEDILVSKTAALTLQREYLMKLQDEIHCYAEMTSHILQTHTDHEVEALGDLLPTELKATLKKVESVSLTPNQSSDIHVSLCTDPLIKELSTFGHVIDLIPSPSQSQWSVTKVNEIYTVNMETITSKGERYPYGGLQVKAEMRPKSHDGAVVLGKVKDHGDGAYAISLTPQTVGPYQLLITMDGQHVQKSPCDLYVRKNYCNLCEAEQVIHCVGPSGIAIHADSGNIYVTCFKENRICIFDQSGKQKRIIGIGGKDYGQLDRPHGIFIQGDVMYIADLGNHRIQKFTTKGRFLQKFGQHGKGQGQFNFPTSVIIDQRNRLIVTDHHNHRVAVLDENGTWLLTINSSVSSSPASMQHPHSLALDPQGNIHVAAYSSNTIKVFTPEGTYVRSYGDLKGPSGIVIDEEGYSLVNERNGDCLSIFDPRGTKIHTIGNLSKPRGVILDPKRGCLYVANFDANTVLKYSL